MPGVLDGKSGLVTGGGRGIGRAIALELGRHGANVAVGYSGNTEAAQSAVEELERLGVRAMAVKGNVAVPEEVKPAVASVAERFGKIDFLVNNAGITRDRSLAKMQHDDWNVVIAVNLHTILNVTYDVLR